MEELRSFGRDVRLQDRYFFRLMIGTRGAKKKKKKRIGEGWFPLKFKEERAKTEGGGKGRQSSIEIGPFTRRGKLNTQMGVEHRSNGALEPNNRKRS